MAPIPVMRYRPTAEGLERWLGPLEASIMAVFWSARAPRTVRQVWRAIAAQHVAYTTVMTTMSRLTDKGLLRRDLPQGTVAHVYRITCSQAEFMELQVRAIMTSLAQERGA